MNLFWNFSIGKRMGCEIYVVGYEKKLFSGVWMGVLCWCFKNLSFCIFWKLCFVFVMFFEITFFPWSGGIFIWWLRKILMKFHYIRKNQSCEFEIWKGWFAKQTTLGVNVGNKLPKCASGSCDFYVRGFRFTVVKCEFIHSGYIRKNLQLHGKERKEENSSKIHE
jgi:hypothetical protein